MGRISISLCSVMVVARVTMRIAEYSLILCSLFLYSNGLNCRSEGGPKENELKSIYDICMKQENKNENSNNEGQLHEDWRETRRHNQWSHDNVASNRGSSNSGYGMKERRQGEGNRNSRDRTEDEHENSWQDRRSKSRDNKMQHREGDKDSYSTDGEESMYPRQGRNDKQNSRGDNRSQRNNGLNDRNDFSQNDNFGEYNNNNYNPYSTQSVRRYKRERRVEVNSGKRSQYNPNPQRFSDYEERNKDEGRNSSKSNSTTDDKNNTCAMHCLLESLQMIDETGMPDRYMVTHKITKDVKDEDLKDFLQESIEECFQLLDNENTDDKCEFSSNLLMCLSEKGRANCDDWKDDFQF